MAMRPAFGELLRRHRLAAGYSQQALAERAGISAAAVAALEQGVRRAPYRHTVQALADALSCEAPERAAFEQAAATGRKHRRRTVLTLPLALTSFIERNELDEIEALLPHHRLLTIVGLGGVGKTRIAIEIGRRRGAMYDDTCFVDMLPVRDGSLVACQLASRLNVPVEGDDCLARVAQHLRRRHVMLIVDNCEHLVAEVAAALARLLREVPTLTVLATSREALETSGELAFRLPSMDTEVAAKLFVARARASDHHWSVDPQRLCVVAEICSGLQGIPLAIELAASHLPALGLDALRSRFKYRPILGGTRDLPERHRTMEATIAWSYDLLTHDERTVFRRLSVLAGGFRLAAAEEVCPDDVLHLDRIAEAVAGLVRKSLLDVRHIETTTRYRFLDCVRDFAFDRLVESGELDAAVRASRRQVRSSRASPEDPRVPDRRRHIHGGVHAGNAGVHLASGV